MFQVILYKISQNISHDIYLAVKVNAQTSELSITTKLEWSHLKKQEKMDPKLMSKIFVSKRVKGSYQAYLQICRQSHGNR